MFPVIILAGGLATRLRPITETIPKAMIDINGKPFIEYQLNLLKIKGITNVILCVGYLGEMIEEYVRDGSDFNMNVSYSYDGEKLLGTGGAIKKAITDLDERFFILYGDSYLDLNYAKIEESYIISKKSGLMTVYKNNNLFDVSNVVFRNNLLIKYSKKIKSLDMNYIDYGLGILEKQVFIDYNIGDCFDLAEIYENLAVNNQLFGYEVFNKFYEIGSQEGLKDFTHFIMMR